MTWPVAFSSRVGYADKPLRCGEVTRCANLRLMHRNKCPRVPFRLRAKMM
jgi:hypothetical protein